MTTITEGVHCAEFIMTEANGSRSRETVTIAAAAPAMVAGTLVGKITATGKFSVYNNAASDGSEVAAGIVYDNVADKTVDQRVTIIARHAEVVAALLTGSDAAGLADLKALAIIAR